jgi:hypothetical protein
MVLGEGRSWVRQCWTASEPRRGGPRVGQPGARAWAAARRAAVALALLVAALPLSEEVPGWPTVAAPADVVSVLLPAAAGSGAPGAAVAAAGPAPGEIRLKGRLHVPTLLRGEPTAPAVLLLPGVPPVDACEDFAVGLRDAGVHCLVMQYRGCWGSEGDFSLSTLAADVAAALEWLAR